MDFVSHGKSTVYLSGCENLSLNGVAIVVSNSLNKAILGYEPISDRIISIKLNAQPCKINIIQVYAPTAAAPVEEIQECYEQLEHVVSRTPNREVLIIQGGFNAKIGDTNADTHMRSLVGPYGLGIRNERGERLLEFCVDNDMTVCNTLFQHHARRRYTWISPGDRVRNQIDFILVRQRWRTSILDCKTFPGADCGSDHNLLAMKMRIKLKIIKRNRTRSIRATDRKSLQEFGELIRPKLRDLHFEDNEPVSQSWENLKILFLHLFQM